MDNLKQTWESFLERIEKTVGKESLDRWFRPLTLESWGDGQAVVTVPNQFYADWIQEHYAVLLSQNLTPLKEPDPIQVQIRVREPEDGPAKEEKTPSAGTVGQEGRPGKKGSLILKYTFESFVPGPFNQFAHAAALAVAQKPGEAYNPLYIYGGVGLGKTHLLNAIGHSVLKRGHMRVAYITSEQFTNEVINSIRHDRMVEFRNRYRSIDVLLIDDIQFIAGKERTQEEFFHTFNTLYESNKQIVVSSDRSTKDIGEIAERLRSRFEMGLIADIQTPDLETKIAILKKKSEMERFHLPDDVAHLLASSHQSNIRELEGSLTRLRAFSSLTHEEITLDFAKRVLRDLLTERRRILSIEEIQHVVAEHFHLKAKDLETRRRTSNIVYPRQIAMYLCRELTDQSFPEIGRRFGGKDHSTVIHACRRVGQLHQNDPDTRILVEGLIQKLRHP